MPRITPFESWLVTQQHASRVVSPAYDAVSPKERREFARENPDNFLNTMRLMEDFPEDGRPGQGELLQINRQTLERILDSGSFARLAEPSLFAYQLDSGNHVQTGIVCEVPVEEYDQGKIRKHENTLQDKESLLAQYLEVVGVSSSPICLAYPRCEQIDRVVSGICDESADLSFTSFDDVHQRIWRISDPKLHDRLGELFRGIEVSYLTAGHHRAASGSRYTRMIHERPDDSRHRLLVVLFPDNQLRLLPFHRCVRDLNDKTAGQILDELSRDFRVTRLDSDSFAASRHGQFGLLLDDVWYRLDIKQEIRADANPVDRLDATILQNLVLDPVFGIKDMRNDPRLDYVPDVGGMDVIRDKVADGWPAILVLHAASIDQLMAVADANELMPPKSTYFDPKPRSGIFIRER